jgi:hypothetical protein
MSLPSLAVFVYIIPVERLFAVFLSRMQSYLNYTGILMQLICTPCIGPSVI